MVVIIVDIIIIIYYYFEKKFFLFFAFWQWPNNFPETLYKSYFLKR